MPRAHRSPFDPFYPRRTSPVLPLIFIAALASVLVLQPPGARAAAAATAWHVIGSSVGACTQADPNCRTIQAAVDAASSGDSIFVDVGTYKENVIVSKDLAIYGGANTTVDGTQAGRVFTVHSGTVSLSGMTITNGKTDLNGGGIYNCGTLSLDHVTVSNNAAGAGGAGGIFNCGMLRVTDSTVSGNTDGGNGGGGIFNNGAATATVTRSIISNNSAGGILNGGTMNVTDTTVGGNTAFEGGGIANFGALSITNCTVSGNTASAGGGILNNGELNVTSSTVSNNAAREGGGIIYLINQVNDSSSKLTNSIVAGNTASFGPDLRGQFISQGHNLIGKSNGSTGFNDGVNDDIVGTADGPVDPRLAPLGNYGGPTQTQLLLCGSPAIDAGDNSASATDQRGVARPAGEAADMGAVEMQRAQINSQDGGAGSLRQLIQDAPGGAVIDLDQCMAVTVTLTSGGIGIDKDLTLNGPGPDLMTVRRSAAQGTPEFLIFDIFAREFTVNLSGMTVSNGRSPEGGGIYNGGTTSITNCTISGNSAAGNTPTGNLWGGGIFNSGALTVTDCTVNNNVADEGGGIYNAGGNPVGGTLTVTNSTINNNSTGSKLGGNGGGGIFNDGGTLTVTNSTVSNNHSADFGGGILNNAGCCLQIGALTVMNSTVSGNSAIGGGGIENNAGVVNVSGSIVAGNTASTGPDLEGAGGQFTSQGHNLVGKSDKFTPVFADGVNGDIVGTTSAPVDPHLLPLGDYGGPTRTQLPRPSSPAIDAGDDAVPDTLPGLTTDQRGFARKAGSHVDIGAVEFDPGVDTVDGPQFFVRQHYNDFLNRAPDPSGFQFWTSQIAACGSNLACASDRRVNVSAAFFLSIEFQQTGYYVYRVRKAAFGDINPPAVPVPVRFGEFLGDSQAVAKGVVVGIRDWQQQLENNKRAFAFTFVQRPEFLARYPGLTGAAEFVNTLNANAGDVLNDAERLALISELSSDPTDINLRADVLRKVAENVALQQHEFDRAFVLMEYFGYLRRDPDDPPDSDFSGYNFWLSKLDGFGGDFQKAEMVRAFINSAEYKRRFGQ
jgi:hypothetical protein